MAVDDIRYDLLAQEALRGVVRRVLADAAKRGLPGEHHFYISFDTQAPGVRLSPRLREQYPGEMTIILQHQFWDLQVTEEGFEVGLSFNGIPERLGVPFAAIKGFFDPSVQFGLQFTTVEEPAEAAEAPAPEKPVPAKPIQGRPPAAVPAAKPAAAPPATSVPGVQPPAPAAAAPAKSEPEPEPKPAGEVVQLDRFRKK